MSKTPESRLLDLYDRVAEAPDAIDRLRKFILDLAVRGKLVEQDPADEPASELFGRTSATGVQRKSGRKNGPIAAERQDLIFDIPPHWVPIFVSQALDELQTGPFGSSLHKSDYEPGGTPVLNPASIQEGSIVPIPDMAVGPKTLERLTSFKVHANDILMARRGEMGRCAIISEREAGWLCGTGSLILRPSNALFPEYLALVISSPTGRAFLGGAAVGTTMQNLNQSILLRMPLGLPPLPEQHRIVTKVDELMTLLDRLETTRTQRETTRDRLTTASLARLTAPESTEKEFRAHASFTLDYLDQLASRPEQIKLLRQTILNLAVRGKMVEQDQGDEPASELLERAKLAKETLRKERRISRNEIPEFSESSGETGSPMHWEWVHLSDFALVLGGKRLPGGASFSPIRTDHIYIRVTDMKGGTISPKGIKYISPEVRRHISKYTIDQDDIYITIAGTIGDVGQVPEMFHGQNLTENAAKIVFREVDRDFLILALRSDDVQNQFAEKTKQMAQPKLALKRILGARIPLPPLAEQQRIVAKVDALMALCDRLEDTLSTADDTRGRLLERLVQEGLQSLGQDKKAA